MYAFVLKLALYIEKGYADKPVLLLLENTKTKGWRSEAIALLGLDITVFGSRTVLDFQRSHAAFLL